VLDFAAVSNMRGGIHMRAHSVAAALFASIVFSGAAFAAAPPDSVLFAGYIKPTTVNPNSDGTWCMTDGASSSFVQSQSPKATLISFSEIYYTSSGSVGPTAYRLSGQARLVFAAGSTTRGTISFDANNQYPASIYQPIFNAYSQSYNATTHTLTVRVTLHFPGCLLPITAIYRN
jgi:hypothetical protein